MVLTEDLQNVAEDEVPCRYEKRTLLSKYEIPVQNLDFEYVEKCQNGRELEKILHILRSGEEGYFPDLIKTTEKRLTEIKPNSKLLRKVCPVLNKNEINMDEWETLSQDLKDWVKDVNKMDRELENRKIKFDTSILTDGEVRKGKTMQEETKSNSKRISSTDYESWDKYDPDTEIVKMDLEDEKLKKQALKSQAEEKKKKAKAVRFNNFATEAEAIFEANREKERGNECFKAKEYRTALQHYTISLECKPFAAVYTNRALMYNKLKKYNKAIDDCIAALKLEPRNFKAYLRLAQNYEALEQFNDALKSIESAIEIDPNNMVAQETASRLYKICGKISVNTRLKIEDIETDGILNSSQQSNSHSTSNSKPLKPILKNSSKYEVEDDSIPALEMTNMKNDLAKQNENSEVKNLKTFNNKQKNKIKSATTKSKNYEIISIPGTSKMPPPYYKVIESNDPEIVKREKQKILFKPTLLHLTTIDVTSDDDDQKDQYDILRSPFIYHVKQTTKLEIRNSQQNSPQKYSKTNKMKTSDRRNKPKKNNVTSSPQKNEKIINDKINPNEKGGGGEPFNNIQEELIPTTEELQSPYTFIQVWNSIRKDASYQQHAQVLKKMDIKLIPEVIGYKLDDTMLRIIINCLYHHFMVPGELDDLYSILVNITRIPRFKTMSLFLEESDWRCIIQLTQFLDQHGRSIPKDIKDTYYSH